MRNLEERKDSTHPHTLAHSFTIRIKTKRNRHVFSFVPFFVGLCEHPCVCTVVDRRHRESNVSLSISMDLKHM